MIHRYFVAFHSRLHTSASWTPGNMEVITPEPMEVGTARDFAVKFIANALGENRVVALNNWILLRSDFSPLTHAEWERSLIDEALNYTTSALYLVSFSSICFDENGRGVWRTNQAQLTIDQFMELECVRNDVAAYIATLLSQQFGGEHQVVISNWQLLQTIYASATRNRSNY